MRLQVYVSDELGERIEAMAAMADRSVSQWVRLTLEQELAHAVGSARPPTLAAEVGAAPVGEGNVPLATVPASSGPSRDDATKRLRDEIAKVCSHAKTVKRTTEALGTRTFCANPDCGKML